MQEGAYTCVGCQAPLYYAKHKFNSGCGWPAFYDGVPGAIEERPDPDGSRIEIVCSNCKGHLGHVVRKQDSNNRAALALCLAAGCKVTCQGADAEGQVTARLALWSDVPRTSADRRDRTTTKSRADALQARAFGVHIHTHSLTCRPVVGCTISPHTHPSRIVDVAAMVHCSAMSPPPKQGSPS